MFGIFKISEGARELANAIIDNPLDWIQGDYYYHHKTHMDLSIWTANGTFFIKLNGNDCFSTAEKTLINNAIKKAISKKAIMQIKDK